MTDKEIALKERKLSKDIKRCKDKLIKKAKRIGLWENFGQEDVRRLHTEYDHMTMVYGTPKERAMASEIQNFNYWCMEFDLSNLQPV